MAIMRGDLLLLAVGMLLQMFFARFEEIVGVGAEELRALLGAAIVVDVFVLLEAIAAGDYHLRGR